MCDVFMSHKLMYCFVVICVVILFARFRVKSRSHRPSAEGLAFDSEFLVLYWSAILLMKYLSETLEF